MLARAKKTGDAVIVANSENSLRDCKEEKDRLEIFKKDLGTFVRYYEFMSQIVDYDDTDLEKLSLYARHLRPMLRESKVEEDDIDVASVQLTHYRLSKIREQDLRFREDAQDYELEPGAEAGSGKAKDKQEEFLSRIIERLNEVFDPELLTDNDQVNYLFTVADKVRENTRVINQIENNTKEQAMLGDFPAAVDEAIMESGDAHQNQMMQLLSDPAKAKVFAELLFQVIKYGSPRPNR